MIDYALLAFALSLALFLLFTTPLLVGVPEQPR